MERSLQLSPTAFNTRRTTARCLSPASRNQRPCLVHLGSTSPFRRITRDVFERFARRPFPDDPHDVRYAPVEQPHCAKRGRCSHLKRAAVAREARRNDGDVDTEAGPLLRERSAESRRSTHRIRPQDTSLRGADTAEISSTKVTGSRPGSVTRSNSITASCAWRGCPMPTKMQAAGAPCLPSC